MGFLQTLRPISGQAVCSHGHHVNKLGILIPGWWLSLAALDLVHI